MSVESVATNFKYGRDDLVMVFCSKCKSWPIIMKKEVYLQVKTANVEGALLCRNCGKGAPR